MSYGSDYFDYIERGSLRSARIVVRECLSLLPVKSVLDLGCGRGAWIAEWQRAGVEDVVGVDGEYVQRDRLLVEPARFIAADLRTPVDLGRTFDLVQSLEVAEHLPHQAASMLVDSIARHGDIVLFCAATPGQGGEGHVNEQALSYWKAMFEVRGYTAYDAVRPRIANHRSVKPYYRFNILVYIRGQLPLQQRLTDRRVLNDNQLDSFVPGWWRARCALVGMLPRPASEALARAKRRIGNALAARG